MQDKTIGYILLSVGIIIMIFGIVQTALLVTHKVKPFPSFQFTEIFKTSASAPGTDIQTLLAQAQGTGAESALQTAAVSALNPAVANEVLNFAAYFFFMSFLATIGYKIADLGIKLIRPAVLHMSPRDVQNSIPPPPVTQ